MSTPIIPQTLSSAQDLCCPACGSLCRYDSSTRVVACLQADWLAVLTPEQNGDLLDALTGVSELNLPAFLLNVHVTAGSASPSPDRGAFLVPGPCGWMEVAA